MLCQSPMSRGEFNGSRNVLTLLSVKMTERDMRPQRHRGPPRHYYHSIGSSGKANTVHHKLLPTDWLAGPAARHVTPLDVISAQHPGRTIFYQWINERSFSCNELGFLWSSLVELHTLYPFTNPHNPAILLSPSRTPSPLSAVERCSLALALPPPELCSSALWWQSNIFVWETSSVEVFSFWRGALHHIHIILSKELLSTCASPPHSAAALHRTTHTHPGLMHFIKEATRGGQEFIGIHHCAIAAQTDEKRPVAPFLSLICVCALFSVPLKQSATSSSSRDSAVIVCLQWLVIASTPDGDSKSARDGAKKRWI